VVEPGEAGASPLQLGGPQRLRALAQGDDDGGDLAGGGGGPVALELLVEDRADGVDLPAAFGQAAVGEGAEVVHVEDGDAGDVGHGGLDVAGHGDVDEHERLTAA